KVFQTWVRNVRMHLHATPFACFVVHSSVTKLEIACVFIFKLFFVPQHILYSHFSKVDRLKNLSTLKVSIVLIVKRCCFLSNLTSILLIRESISQRLERILFLIFYHLYLCWKNQNNNTNYLMYSLIVRYFEMRLG